MKGEAALYEYLYQSLLTRIYHSGLRHGQQFPSQQALCRQYGVGITTVRKVYQMLERDGFLHTEPRKRALVVCDVESRACAAALVRRKPFILDLYQGLTLLLPPLYAGGAAHCRSFDGLRAILASIREDTALPELPDLASRFFLELLKPYRNQVMCDLQTDSEHFTRILHPQAADLADPNGLTPGGVRAMLASLLDAVQRRDTASVRLQMQDICIRSGAYTKRYLDALEARCPQPREEAPQDRYIGKSRAHLYTSVARQLHLRILNGEFSACKYLPSLPDLMEMYGISQATALSALALLNDIGAVRTLDKRGSVVPPPGTPPAPLRLDGAVIRENLVFALDALQLLAVSAQPLTAALFPTLSGQAADELLDVWAAPDGPPTTAVLVRTLLALFKAHAPGGCLRGFFGQMDDLMLWGHYLERCPHQDAALAAQAASCSAALSAALAARDGAAFSRQVGGLFLLVYRAARPLALQSGLTEAQLPLPLDGAP